MPSMTPELQAKLAGLLPFAKGTSLPFTPEAFHKIDESLRPRFFIRPFPGEVRKTLDPKLAHADQLDRETMVYALAEGEEDERALACWENLVDYAQGSPIPYSKDVIPRLTDHLIGACFWQAMLYSGLTVLEKETAPTPAQD